MNNIIDFNRQSNSDKVLRITTWILRFVCNLKGVKIQKTILKPKELREAKKLLVQATQFKFHLTDINDSNSKFSDLNVKLDKE